MIRLSPPRLQGLWSRPAADCHIAAAAVGIDAGLATADVDDFPIPELRVEHWPVDG